MTTPLIILFYHCTIIYFLKLSTICLIIFCSFKQIPKSTRGRFCYVYCPIFQFYKNSIKYPSFADTAPNNKIHLMARQTLLLIALFMWNDIPVPEFFKQSAHYNPPFKNKTTATPRVFPALRSFFNFALFLVFGIVLHLLVARHYTVDF